VREVKEKGTFEDKDIRKEGGEIWEELEERDGPIAVRMVMRTVILSR
jgi:hypothetical protein